MYSSITKKSRDKLHEPLRCLVTPSARKSLPKERNQGKQHGKHAEQGWNERWYPSCGFNVLLFPSWCGITDLLPLLNQPVTERLEILRESSDIQGFASGQLLKSLRPRFTLSHLKHVTRGNVAKIGEWHVFQRFHGILSSITFINQD